MLQGAPEVDDASVTQGEKMCLEYKFSCLKTR